MLLLLEGLLLEVVQEVLLLTPLCSGLVIVLIVYLLLLHELSSNQTAAARCLRLILTQIVAIVVIQKQARGRITHTLNIRGVC